MTIPMRPIPMGCSDDPCQCSVLLSMFGTPVNVRYPPVAVLRCGTGKPKAPPRKGQGLWPAGILVGVTGLEPPASSSRTSRNRNHVGR